MPEQKPMWIVMNLTHGDVKLFTSREKASRVRNVLKRENPECEYLYASITPDQWYVAEEKIWQVEISFDPDNYSLYKILATSDSAVLYKGEDKESESVLPYVDMDGFELSTFVVHNIRAESEEKAKTVAIKRFQKYLSAESQTLAQQLDGLNATQARLYKMLKGNE